MKTKKTVMPMTTPRPAIPREKFIQHDDRDSGILTLKLNDKSINANANAREVILSSFQQEPSCFQIIIWQNWRIDLFIGKSVGVAKITESTMAIGQLIFLLILL